MRTWIWMAVFAVVFLILGSMDLMEGETLTGSGLLVCGFGAAAFTVGDRRAGEGKGERARAWRVLGGIVSLVGIGLLSLAVFG